MLQGAVSHEVVLHLPSVVSLLCSACQVRIGAEFFPAAFQGEIPETDPLDFIADPTRFQPLDQIGAFRNAVRWGTAWTAAMIGLIMFAWDPILTGGQPGPIGSERRSPRGADMNGGDAKLKD